VLLHMVAAREIGAELLHSLAPPPAIEAAVRPRNGDAVGLAEQALE
jgi:hypothetical protein